MYLISAKTGSQSQHIHDFVVVSEQVRQKKKDRAKVQISLRNTNHICNKRKPRSDIELQLSQ